MKARAVKRTRRNPDLFDSIRPGDRVTIVNRFGQERTGRATIINRKDGVVVLNMGGPHGTPGIATRDNVVRVVPGRGKRGGFIFNGRKRRRNPVYLEVGRGGKRGQKGFGFGVGYRARENASGSRSSLAYVTARLHKALLYLRGMACRNDHAKADNARLCIVDALGLVSELMKGAENPMLGVFGANPKARVVRELGRVVEVRYKRKDDGGLYFHKYSSKPRLLALSDGSIWIKGA